MTVAILDVHTQDGNSLSAMFLKHNAIRRTFA